MNDSPKRSKIAKAPKTAKSDSDDHDCTWRRRYWKLLRRVQLAACYRNQPGTQQTLVKLLAYQRENADCYPSYEALATYEAPANQVTARTLKRWIKQLVDQRVVRFGELKRHKAYLRRHFAIDWAMLEALKGDPSAVTPEDADRSDPNAVTPEAIKGDPNAVTGRSDPNAVIPRGDPNAVTRTKEEVRTTEKYELAPSAASGTGKSSSSQKRSVGSTYARGGEAPKAQRARAKKPRGAPPRGAHAYHAICGSPLCLPHFLHDQFVRNLGGRDLEQNARDVHAFAVQLNDECKANGTVIGDSDKFWRECFKTFVVNRARAARAQERAANDNAPPPFMTLDERQRELLRTMPELFPPTDPERGPNATKWVKRWNAAALGAVVAYLARDPVTGAPRALTPELCDWAWDHRDAIDRELGIERALLRMVK